MDMHFISNLANTSQSNQMTDMQVERRKVKRLVSNGSSVSSGKPPRNKQITNSEALTHLVKATIGGGFLAMPEAFHNAGLLVGTIGTIFLGLSVLNMMSSIVRISQALRISMMANSVSRKQNDEIALDGSIEDEYIDNDESQPKIKGHEQYPLPPMDYSEMVAAVFERGASGRFAYLAPYAKACTTTFLIMTYYGVNIIYVCIVATSTKQIVDTYTTQAAENTWASLINGLSIHWYPSIIAILIIPVGMIKVIKLLTPFSMTANGCLLIGAGAVFYYILIGSQGQEPLSPEESPKLVVWPITLWSLFAGSTLCSLEGIGMLLHVENTMAKPWDLAGPPGFILHKSMIIIIIVNGALGFCGYWRYGDRCLGSVSLNLPKDNILSDAIKILIAFGILLTYGLQLTVTADLTWKAMCSKISGITKDFEDTTKNDKTNSLKSVTYYYSMRFMLIVGSIIVATIVPDIAPLVSLVGSIGFSLLGMILPVIVETVWYWDPKTDDEENKEERYSGCSLDTLENGDCSSGSGAEVIADSSGGGGGSGVEVVVSGGGGSTDDSNGDGGNVRVTTTVREGRWHNSAVHRRRTIRRTLRHIKNVTLIIVGIYALIGGAFYNIHDIIKTYSGDSATSSV